MQDFSLKLHIESENVKISKYDVEQEVLVSLDHSQLMLCKIVQYFCRVLQHFTSVLQIIPRES